MRDTVVEYVCGYCIHRVANYNRGTIGEILLVRNCSLIDSTASYIVCLGSIARVPLQIN